MAIIQILLGNSMVFFGVSSILFYFHFILAVLILIVCIYGIRVTKEVRRRIVLGNLFLLIVTSIIGGIYTLYPNIYLLLFHLFLALGIVSNFSVLYGMDRD
ncbi:hypothetical protein SJAV_17210 [Sulfurisphaera javensis]|uniref:Uncharacterized protein n=1 Tax=Sulfurisphaera javensis TaxID=2049879 RepID=A0AAT9GT26_9CREN